MSTLWWVSVGVITVCVLTRIAGALMVGRRELPPYEASSRCSLPRCWPGSSSPS